MEMRTSEPACNAIWPLDFQCYKFPSGSASNNMLHNANGSYTFIGRLVSMSSPFRIDRDCNGDEQQTARQCKFPNSSRLHKLKDKFDLLLALLPVDDITPVLPTLVNTSGRRESAQHRLANSTRSVNHSIRPGKRCILSISPWIRMSNTITSRHINLFVYVDILTGISAHCWWREMSNRSPPVAASVSALKARTAGRDVTERGDSKHCPVSCFCEFSRERMPVKILVDVARRKWPRSTDVTFVRVMEAINARWSKPTGGAGRRVTQSRSKARIVTVEQCRRSCATLRGHPIVVVGGVLRVELRNFSLAQEDESVARCCLDYCKCVGK